MPDEQFKNQMEALAVKKLDKPKKLAVECMRHWKEIMSRQHSFDRGEDIFCFVFIFERNLPSPCTAFSQALTINSFR